MPQLDPEVFSPQIVWLAITFVVLYVLMTRIALPRVGEMLEARQDKITHDLDAAATYKAEAEQVLADYEATMAKARSEAQSMLARAADERAREAARRQAELDARLDEELREAEARIAKAKEDAMAGLERVAGEIARDVAQRLAGLEVDARAAKAAVTAARKAGR